MPITLSDNAVKHLRRMKEDKGDVELLLRVGVRSGGCSGLSYAMDFEDSSKVTAEDSGVCLRRVTHFQVSSPWSADTCATRACKQSSVPVQCASRSSAAMHVELVKHCPANWTVQPQGASATSIVMSATLNSVCPVQ